MLTLGELKKMVVSAEDMARVPNYYTLRKMEVPVVVKEVMEDKSEITVYENGLVSYRSGLHGAVFTLHGCRGYVYECSSMQSQYIRSDFFENERWYYRLILEGEDRIEKNIQKRESKYTVSYSAISEEWEVLQVDYRMLETIIEQETLKEILTLLTEHQRNIMEEMYFIQRTQEQIAEQLGITQQAVSDVIKNAMRKIRKKYPKDNLF